MTQEEKTPTPSVDKKPNDESKRPSLGERWLSDSEDDAFSFEDDDSDE